MSTAFLRSAVLFALTWLIAAATAAQSKPDFSGDWVLVSPQDSPGRVAREMTVELFPQGRHGKIGQLTVHRRFERSGLMESFFIGTIGGTVSGVVPERDPSVPLPQTRHSVTWDGDRLVIEKGSYSGPSKDDGPWTEYKEVWSVTPQGTLLITATDQTSGAERVTTDIRYRRR